MAADHEREEGGEDASEPHLELGGRPPFVAIEFRTEHSAAMEIGIIKSLVVEGVKSEVKRNRVSLNSSQAVHGSMKLNQRSGGV